MKKIAMFTIVLILLILFMPCVVFAKESYTISVNKGKAERDGKLRNWVTVDDFLYYSFYDTKASFTKDGDKYTLTLPANKYTSKNGDGSASGTISVPKITFKGTGKDGKYDEYIITMTGTIDGTITSHTKGDFEKNYKFNITDLQLTLRYSTKLVKNGKVDADAELRFSYTSSNDVGEQAYTGTDMKSIYVSTITISGIGGAAAKATATPTKNTTKNIVAITNTIKENTTTNEVVPAVTTEETEIDENGFPVGPVVGIVATIAIIGGTAVYITKFGPSSKIVKDPVTGEIKKYHLDKETGEYVSEDGKTILNTEMMDEVAKQAIKDKEFMDKEHQKLINRETATDDLNRQMVKENIQMQKDFERQKYVEKIASEHGIMSDEIADVKKELGQIQEKNIEKDKAYKQTEKIWDTALKTAEVVDEAADIAITVGETVVPGGKTVSAVYKATKSVASTVAKDGFDKAKIANATIKGLTDAGTTYMSGVGKAAVTVGGEIGGDVTEAVMEGKSASEVWDVTKDAAAKGTAKATIGATGDALGDVVGNEAANVGGYLYQKHVVDPKMEQNLKKGKAEKKK